MATQIIFFHSHPVIVWAEVAALVTRVITLVFGRRARWHATAERIR